MKIDYDKGKYSVSDQLLRELPALKMDKTIKIRVLEYADGNRAYFVDSGDIPSDLLNELLQDLHLKRTHKNTGIS